MEQLNNFFQEEIDKLEPLFYISELFQCVVNPNDYIDFVENDFDDPNIEIQKSSKVESGGLELSATITKSECETLGEGPLMNDNHKNVFRSRIGCFAEMIMNRISDILEITLKLGKTNMFNEGTNLDIHGSDSGSSQKIIDHILSSIIVIRLTTGDIYKNCRYWVVAKSEVCRLIKNHSEHQRISYIESLKYPHSNCETDFGYVCTLDSNIDIYEDKMNDVDQKTSNVCVGINPGFYSKPVKNGIVINIKKLVDNVVFQPNLMGILTNSFDVKLKMNSMFNVLVLGDHPEVNYCAFGIDKINTVEKIKTP